MARRAVTYVTSNPNKRDEIDILMKDALFDDGTRIRDVFDIKVRSISIPERLEIDLEVMVADEAARAYEVLRVPCIVEHAGLILDDFESVSYPGGLTKPMWNALGSRFKESTCPEHSGATAKAVVGYCDGMTVRTFVGSTHGYLSDTPSGSRNFYWDTIFVPDDPKRPHSQQTYASLVDDPEFGLNYKVMSLSQSSKAMLRCLQFIRENAPNLLWT